MFLKQNKLCEVFLRTMKLNNDKLNWLQCINKILCECSTENIRKTGRPCVLG
jgi:hypothetical protein